MKLPLVPSISSACQFESATRSSCSLFRRIASVVADGELLCITTVSDEPHSINYRLKDLEARLDPALFVRLTRGTLVNIEMIARVSPMPGGTFVVTLKNNQQLQPTTIANLARWVVTDLSVSDLIQTEKSLYPFLAQVPASCVY